MVRATVWLRFLGIACLGVAVAGATLWGAVAIYYSDLPGEPLRLGLAATFALGVLGAFLFLRDRRRTLVGSAVAFAAVLLWWTTIAPSNERDWQPEVAVLPYAARDGDLVTLHNIRNFAYRTEQDFVPQYYDRTFDLRELDAVDLIAVYWAGEAIAHIMVSFGFAGEHVAISIETRKEKGEAYSSLAGFFKQYELIYVVGDERDLIRVRTNYRQPEELVYLYRTRAGPEAARRLFLQYIERINRLKEQPEFYNTLTTNCTTDVWLLVRTLFCNRAARVKGFCNRAARVKGSKLAPAPRMVVWQGPLFCPRSAQGAAASWGQARARRINLRGCAVADRAGSFGRRGGFVDVTAAPRPCRTLPPERNS